MKIQLGSSLTMDQVSDSPQLGEVLEGRLVPMTFTSITKTIVNFQVVETPLPIQFMGTWQPFTDRMLLMKPEVQRTWKWYRVSAQSALPLNPDDVITYQGTQYRVMSLRDYSANGHVEYHLIQDYTGAGP